ncbi:MAG: pilus assembly protein PilM [Candidatus Riflebacteria bacterium]|nr:pilus assembly protein PilM [Candidatus Riflebacteria bacterium]
MNEQAPAGFESFVAVDIGSFSLKFAYIQKNEEGGFVLKSLAQMNIPPYEHELTDEQRETMSKDNVREHCLKELRQFLTTHITELLYDNEIQTKRAITFASNREVTIRCIEIPPVVEQDKLVEAVNVEANKQMPFSMGNAVLGYNVQGDTMRDEKALTQIMVAALQKDIVDYVNQNFKGAGLSNEGILTIPQALELALEKQMAPYASGDKKVGVIHCGNSTTSVMIYKNGKIQFFRDVNMAGATITEAIFAGGEVDGQEIKFKHLNEATELKHKLGVMPPDEMQALKGAEKFAAQKIFESVEKIFQHIQLSISFYISQAGETGLDKIILTGGSAAMSNFKEFIEESLEVSTSIAQPFSRMSIGEIKYDEEKRNLEAAALAPILGVAMYKGEKEIINFIDILFPNRKSQSINLSGVSSKFGGGFSARLFELDETKLRIVAGLLGGLLVLAGLYPVVKIRQKVTQSKDQQKKMQDDLKRLNSSQGDITSLLAEQSRLTSMAGLDGELNRYKIINSAIIVELASATPSQIFLTDATFNTDAKPPTFRLQGHADNSDSVFEYLNILGKSPIFDTPVLESTNEMPIDDTRYFIRFALNGKIKAEELKKMAGIASESQTPDENLGEDAFFE